MSGYQQSNACGREAEPPPYTERTPLYTPHRNSNSGVYHPAPTVVNYRSSRITIFNLKRNRHILVFVAFVFILFGLVAGYSFDAVWNAGQRNTLRRGWKIEDERRAEQNRKWEEEEAEHWEREHQRKETERKQKEERNRKWDEEEAEHREMEHQRNEIERKWKEEAERKRISMTWEDMRASDHCLLYGTRGYQAKLGNVALGLDPLEECARKPAVIHGREVLPHRCTHEGICGAVYGHWDIDFGENGCRPSWGDFANKGCVEPGIRRWEARLWNLNGNDDWFEMCRSTPATISGVTLNGPNDCVDYGFVHGKWGIWAIPDPNCNL